MRCSNVVDLRETREAHEKYLIFMYINTLCGLFFQFTASSLHGVMGQGIPPFIWYSGNTDSARNRENNHQRLVHFMTHAQVAHSSWRKETRYCFSFITFCKKQQAYFSALAFILPLLFSFVTMGNVRLS